MIRKSKSVVMFLALIGISCMIFNFASMDSHVYAQGTSTVKTKGCPLDKAERCSSHKDCSKKSKCDKDAGHRINEMMDLAHCAKKELLKEKIKANLEKKIGSKLDQIADLLVDTMLDECRSLMQGKARKSILEKNIGDVFRGKGSQ